MNMILYCAIFLLKFKLTVSGLLTFESNLINRFINSPGAKFDNKFFVSIDPDSMKLKYELYTPRNPTKAYQLEVDNYYALLNSLFDQSLETKLLTHGYLDNEITNKDMKLIKDRYLNISNYNIILVYWFPYNTPPYGLAVAKSVAQLIARLIRQIQEVFNVPLSSFHLLGHSLGSHIVGFTGGYLKNRYNKIGRTTGIDPAGPLFQDVQSINERINPTQADFVDCIHTDSVLSTLVLPLGWGTRQAWCHIDFFPNGGKHQPGCLVKEGPEVGSFFKLHFLEGFRKMFCSHQKAFEYYAETISNNYVPSLSYQCDNYENFLDDKCTYCGQYGERCAYLGHRADEWRQFKHDNKQVTMYLKTTAEKPFFCEHRFCKDENKNIEQRDLSGYVNKFLFR